LNQLKWSRREGVIYNILIGGGGEMPIYHELGLIPHKRHTQFRKKDGGLHSEELFGTEGFDGNASLLYHIHPPTKVKRIEIHSEYKVKYQEDRSLRHYHLRTLDAPKGGDVIEGRIVLLHNKDVSMGIARPVDSMDYYFRNSIGDEVYFIHEGKGILQTNFGALAFHEGDYIIIPKGTTYQMKFDTDDNRILVIESYSPIETPKRYRNEYGQFLEHSPFCERDIRRPEKPLTFDESGEFEVRIKHRGYFHSYYFDFHPFDVVGWDGYLYPWIFNIKDFEPKTGRIHLPPPTHQTFQGRNFVICSFVPRMYDYHPESIPVPYNHSNIDSDEVLYYVDGDFMSRKGVEKASFTLHPGGIPHGPHPGNVEASLGKKETKELAVMLDTFYPLYVTEEAAQFEDKDYPYSWYEN